MQNSLPSSPSLPTPSPPSRHHPNRQRRRPSNLERSTTATTATIARHHHHHEHFTIHPCTSQHCPTPLSFPTSPLSQLRNMPQFLVVIFLFSLLSLMTPTTAQFQEPQPGACTRQSVDTSVPPKFICRYEVVVTRYPDCSLTLFESITLPHTVSPLFNRSLWVGTLQDVEDIQTTFSGVPVPWTLKKTLTGRVCGEGLICIPSLPVPVPVVIVLNLTLREGAMKFAKQCKGSSSTAKNLEEHSNIIRWTSGMRNDTVYDSVNVTFRSLVPGVSMTMLDRDDDDFVGGKIVKELVKGEVVYRTFSNVTKEIEIFVAERGAPECIQTSWCIRRKFAEESGRYTVTFFAIFVICLLSAIALVGLCFCAPCCTKTRSTRNSHTD